ncbi:acyltransferase [Sphingomonas sp. LB-2]|uniref:acyltransferase family protein n=1 Tax=Sphingomonas caeni TaxID=2984949 RepID=UPI002230DE79|nr:acyltransferase [Sphingomonas caeni]MCW3846660.1 acyltransferase [Sphingomonas caeni]
MASIGLRLETIPNPRGFDYMRIGLSICVLISHSFDLSDALAAKHWTTTSPFAPFKLAILPMFFGVSGFLVAGSLARSRTAEGFLTLRAVRLMPALAAEIFLSALLMGPLVTVVPLRAYFSDPLFWRYFLNLLGDPQYLLPGVFLDHPRPEVNGQLWTIPYELWCYGALALLGGLGLMRRRWMGLLFLIGFTLAIWVGGLLTPAPRGPWLYAWSLLNACLAGVVVYLYRYRLPWSSRWGVVSFIATALLYIYPHTRALAMVPIAYFTVWLGLYNPRATWLAGRYDYSYGVYVLAYPIQQLLWSWPPLRPWYANILTALPLTLVAAACSCHFVERPFLLRKRPIVAWVEAVGARPRALLGRVLRRRSPG